MLTRIANEDSRLSFWPRVREFAVPPSMIETATARRRVGDWAGACAAAGIDVDLQLRSVARTHGRELAARIRADLRHLAPDLLRWHMPRIAPDGLLRPGLTLCLARYEAAGRDGPVQLVVRTPPAWADAGQRISLALWDGCHSQGGAGRHPHPRPSRRFRLDLHRHLWDVRRTDELRIRSGADRAPADGRPVPAPDVPDPDVPGTVAYERHCAVERWAAEARILLRAEGRSSGAVLVRLEGRHRLVLELVDDFGSPPFRIAAASVAGGGSALPVLPDAATWVSPDVELIRAGAIEVDRLHPLVASALVPDHDVPSGAFRAPHRAGQPRLVECRGARHRIGLVDGVLAPLDHDPDEIRREELLVALTGTPLPCLQAIDEAHRRPDCLTGVRERLDHGDIAGALAVVEGLLGPDALLRDGALRDELEAAAQRRITYGLFRAGLVGPGPGRIRPGLPRPRGRRSHPRHATAR
ncbi:hypothetical protein ADK57_27520 [Streptomyces sp. MMG1533]|uniref:hypothetical protein n=1 Tax=Streptomyces sp. MMG1533 TaxID=1415546 RepID=UPI0006ADD563|nr:hypothetical protein [Streptomyces sp. MMG1533]KOU61508.1 hypothetical protein ADK57_27520 [Streptomyces sp. MMG1533]